MGDKILTSDNLNLYQQIFCNLYNNPNGFAQYQNSKFNDDIQTNPAVSFSNQASEYNCLQKCKSDDWCTSYRYDTSNGNCTEYTTFPKNITSGINGMNIGYNLEVNYDFDNLSTNQKNNTVTKCVNQYINNTYTSKNSNIDLSPCGITGKVGGDTYTLQIDPKCLYNTYNNAGIPVKTISNANYINNSSWIIPQNDPIIDSVQSQYNEFKQNGESISNINNLLASSDSEDNTNNSIFNSYLDSINDKKNKINDYSDEIKKRIGIEKFENQNKNNMYNNISKFLFFFIIILLIWYIIIMVCK